MGERLTKTQAELLAEIMEKPFAVATYYAPAKKLVEKGLAEWGGHTGAFLYPTEEGRAALREQKDASHE